MINTASSERLKATCRERLAALTRRGWPCTPHGDLQHGMSLSGTGYNFCTPHASLSAAGATTPAMAAGITAHRWTVQALRSFPVPPPRWTPPSQRASLAGIATLDCAVVLVTTVKCGATDFPYLSKKAPFIALELQRQGLVQKIKSIMPY